jgi:tetratricopeptide (TPR) repeat protein
MKIINFSFLLFDCFVPRNVCTLVLSVFAGVLLSSNSFCQESPVGLFFNGKKMQQGAEDGLKTSFKQLQISCEKYGLTRNQLAEFFESGGLTLPKFFDKLEETSQDTTTFQAIAMEFTRTKDSFESALAAYDQAIELNPSFVDAYVKKAEIYAEMRRFKESLEAYRKAEEIGFNLLTEIDLLPLENQSASGELISGELTWVAKQIAKLCSEQLSPLLEPKAPTKVSGTAALPAPQKTIHKPKALVNEVNTPDELLAPLMMAREVRLEQLLSNSNTKEEERQELANLKAMNDFLLAEFYQELGWKTDALNHYNQALAKWQEIFQNYPQLYSKAELKIRELGDKIAMMKATNLSFEIDEGPEVNIQLIPTRDRLFSGDDILFSLLPSGSTVSFSGNVTQKNVWISIDSQEANSRTYSLVITMPNIEVKAKDQMPFEVRFKSRGNVEHLLEKKAQEIAFEPLASEKPLHPLRLSREKDDFTYDSQTYHLLNNRTKQRYPIDEGSYKVQVVSEILLRSDPTLGYTITITPLKGEGPERWIARIIVVAMGLSYLGVR